MTINKSQNIQIPNDIRDTHAQCKIVIYPWQNEANTSDKPNTVLAKTTQLDISAHLTSCSFTKSIAQPSGTFAFTLSNSPEYGTGDWKDIIKRGTWCIIYMAQSGVLSLRSEVGPPNNDKSEQKCIRCIGYIDRVSANINVDEKGAIDVSYTVSGRDFGVIYEDTTIWHNLFKFDKARLQNFAQQFLTIQGSVKLNEVLQRIHDLMFYPKRVPGISEFLGEESDSLLTIALQWLMPNALINDISGLDRGFSSPFWGALDNVLQLETTEAGLAVPQPTDFLSGNAWEKLKRISCPQFHELFTETNDDGIPNLVFRPIPFAVDKRKYPVVGKHITKYKDLPVVTISALDVIDASLGEDDHERYNSFLVTVSTSLIGVEDNISIAQQKDILHNIQDSIKRHGFKPMHVTVDTIIRNAKNQNGDGDAALIAEYSEVLKDYWSRSHLAESGKVNIIGNFRIKVGKCFRFGSDVPYQSNRRYYIEEYTDSFIVDDLGRTSWEQEVILTRGFSESDLVTLSGFDKRDNNFKRQGEFTPFNNGSKRRK